MASVTLETDVLVVDSPVSVLETDDFAFTTYSGTGSTILTDMWYSSVDSGVSLALETDLWELSADYSVLPSYNPSLVSVVGRVVQGINSGFIIGGKGGAAGTSHALFKNSPTAPAFALWRSPVYRFGEPFKVRTIRIPLSEPLDLGHEIVPVLYFDDGSANVGTLISTANYDADTQLIYLTEDNFDYAVAGMNSFFLELRFTGITRIAVTFPITIEIEKIDI